MALALLGPYLGFQPQPYLKRMSKAFNAFISPYGAATGRTQLDFGLLQAALAEMLNFVASWAKWLKIGINLFTKTLIVFVVNVHVLVIENSAEPSRHTATVAAVDIFEKVSATILPILGLDIFAVLRLGHDRLTPVRDFLPNGSARARHRLP